MNIVTKGDVKKFLHLLKVGLKSGSRKELKNYTSATTISGTDIPKEYYVSLEFSFTIDPSEIEELIQEDSFDDLVDNILNK